MAANAENYKKLVEETGQKATLVAVSKLQPVAAIKALYDLGHRDFGENYVQELVEKQPQLPNDVRWHFIGHLQSNKVKYIVPFVTLVQSVDSLKLLREINKQAKKTGRTIDCLLQVHIAAEETKFGLNEAELDEAVNVARSGELPHVLVKGVMGMASFTSDQDKVKAEMQYLRLLFNNYKNVDTAGCQFSILSMGMSGDYNMAIEEGSNMIRVGSLLFGARQK